MRSVTDYLGLITPFHASKPRFSSTVGFSVSPYAGLQQVLASLSSVFDLDLAIGVQLDAVGERVGLTRNIPYPLSNIYFAFDDSMRGFDRGVWKKPYDTSYGIYQLDDDTYRRALRAKILANNWDGSIAGAQAILDEYFIDPATHVFIEDDSINIAPSQYFTLDDPLLGFDQAGWAPSSAILSGSVQSVNMVATIGVAGKIPDLVDLIILENNILGLDPAGITLNKEVISVDSTPLFGFDVSNEYIDGFDIGSFGVPPQYLVNNLPFSP